MSSGFAAFTELTAPSVRFSNLIKINDHEFVGASSKLVYGPTDDLGLYSYNTICNEWKLLLKYPDELLVKGHTICYDKDNQTIYLYGYVSQMLIINLQTLKIDHVIKGLPYTGNNPVLLMINNECHIFLGNESKYHYKWNSKKKKFEEIFKFYHIDEGLHEHGIVDITSKNKLLLFGGYDIGTDICYDEFWEYDMNESYKSYKWTRLNDVK